MEEESNSDEQKDSDSSKPSRKPKANRDLLHRIHDRPEYTAVVRAIGSETWEIEDGRDLVVPLMKRFGVERVRAATEELLAFRSELLVIRKHTLNGRIRFQEAIALAALSLHQFREAEAQRIDQMQAFPLSDRHADSLMLQAYERGIVSHRTLPRVIQAWRTPSHPEFADRNLWSLMNAFTGVIQSRSRSNPQQFALQTIRLSALLTPSACTLRASSVTRTSGRSAATRGANDETKATARQAIAWFK